MKYFSEASVLYMFLTLDIKGMNDIRLISSPIHAPNHELDDTDTNTPPTKVRGSNMAASVAVIRDRVISVRTSSDVTEMTQKQTTVIV